MGQPSGWVQLVLGLGLSLIITAVGVFLASGLRVPQAWMCAFVGVVIAAFGLSSHFDFWSGVGRQRPLAVILVTGLAAGVLGAGVAGALIWGSQGGPPAFNDIVRLEILKVQFDPNPSTEMYVDFRISNPGDPTIVRNWNLSISRSGMKLVDLTPRHLMTDKILTRPLGGIEHDTMTREPLERGGQRLGHLTFTMKDRVPKKEFGIAGTRFDLTAEDIRGRKIESSYVL